MLGACSAGPKPDTFTAECRSLFSELDQKTDAAGARDASSRTVPGFPYLRSNRLFASFADEAGDDARFDRWVQQLRHLDREARKTEMRNLGTLVSSERLDSCGQMLIQHELTAPEWRERLKKAARVDDDYSLLARTLGVYPLSAPFLKLGINGFHKDVRADYAQPLDNDVDGRPLITWAPDPAPVEAAAVAGFVAAAPRDALGIPQLRPQQWWQLARAHAPTWWIETSGNYDLVGAPTTAGFDEAAHVAYFQPGYTRFGGEVLAQLNYVIWFSERPPLKSSDPYSGNLDGIVWRVTLDHDGLPLLYDTIHPCGCYHYYFPAKPLRHIAEQRFWQEPMLLPQVSVPAGPVAVRVQTETHYVRRVVPAADAVSSKHRIYRLRPYSELQSLPTADGRHRSLFGEDGLVDGSERGERRWLWISGISSPGAMRELGRHATAFVGREHFDDPWLLDRAFARP